MPITEAQLKAAAKALPASMVPVWVPVLNAAMARYAIDTRNRIIDFMAHALHESAELTRLVENLNYSAEGMARVWPNRYAIKQPDSSGPLPNALALRLHRKPEEIANHTYANRMGNGPPESGDGWKYRGRGIFMNTGKANYIACGEALEINLVSDPSLLEKPQWAAMAAGWHWNKTNCNALSDGGDPDFKLTTKAVNGGLIGLVERVEYRKKLREVIR